WQRRQHHPGPAHHPHLGGSWHGAGSGRHRQGRHRQPAGRHRHRAADADRPTGAIPWLTVANLPLATSPASASARISLPIPTSSTTSYGPSTRNPVTSWWKSAPAWVPLLNTWWTRWARWRWWNWIAT